MKRPLSSTVRKGPVFLDPAFPSYRGYLPPTPSSDDDDHVAHGAGRPHGLDRVDAASITPQGFFESYVSRRKPCLLFNLIDGTRREEENDIKNPAAAQDYRSSAEPVATDPAQLLQALHGQLKDATFQMEVRETSREAFGQNRTAPGRQVEMTFGEFFEKVPANEKHRYYLSTQQSSRKEEDDDEDEGAYDPSGSRLVDALEDATAHPKVARALERARQLAGSLLLDSKHGWLGFSPVAANDGEGVPLAPSCSGLHHDFHDNVNVQLVGTKAWTLYPPTEYPNIPLYGTIHGIHGFNGLICYRDNVTRADGVPLSVLLQDDDDDDDDDEDNEGATGAFGNPSGDDDEDEQDEEGREGDDGDSTEDASNGADDEDNKGTRKRPVTGDGETQRRPNSFSPVDMTLSAEDRARRHPDFCPRQEITVEVRAGEALYLPASWFHSVSSSAADVGSDTAESASTAVTIAPHPPYHLAVNYWYHPPDQDDFQQPYRNDYWAKHMKTKTQKY